MAVAPSTASTVLALDFDGVVCDSEPESSISGWKHAVALWPEVFDDETQYARVLEGLKRTRPVVETGFENTLLARCILEKTHSADAIVNDWGALMPELMERWQLDRAEMVRGYGAIRDDWMAADLDGWLAPNLIYPGVGEAVRLAESSRHADVFVVTTKQARFASAIMSQKANLEIPPERLFSQTVSGVPKTEVLLALQADAAPGARLVFVEDKMSTLEKVCARDGLETWELFLVDWGYNTEEERARARANPRIRVVDLETFAETLGEAAKGGGVEKRRECTRIVRRQRRACFPDDRAFLSTPATQAEHTPVHTEPAVETLSEKARHATRQRWSARHDGGRDGTGGRVSGGREDRRASPRRSGRARLWETRVPRLGGTPPGVIGRRVGVCGCVVRSHRAPPGRGGAYASDSGGAPPVPGRASRGYVAGASGASRRG